MGLSARSQFVGERANVGFGVVDGGGLDHTLFCGADRQALAPIVASLQVRNYRPGEIVVRPGPDRADLHLVLSGRLCIFDLTMDGHRLIFEYVAAGDFDGLLPVCGLRGHFSEAVEYTRILPLSQALLDRVIDIDPRTGSNLLHMVSRRLQFREDQLRSVAVRNPSQRLAAHLLAMARSVGTRRGGSWVTPRISHEALADMLGLRRETVTLHMGRLGRMHAVTVDKRSFVLDTDMLAALRDASPHHEHRHPLRFRPERLSPAAAHRDGNHSSIQRARSGEGLLVG